MTARDRSTAGRPDRSGAPPRVAILGSRGIPARYGGFETFAEEIGARLVERGVEVTVFCEMPTGGPPRAERHRGVALVHRRAPRWGPLSTLAYDAACLVAARRGFDVVYMLGYSSAVLCAPARLGEGELWMNMDGLEWQRSKWPWYGRLFLRGMEAAAAWSCDLMVCDAEAVRSHLESRYRRLPPRVVIPYGALAPDPPPTTERLEAFGLEPDGYYLVVARLEPENHLVEIVEGFCATECTAPLVVVGDDRVANEFVRRLRRRASDRVRFFGGVYDPGSLWTLRWHARGYLHGHSVGGTNPSLVESMAAGNAVVAHDNAFNREVLGEAGRFFGDIGELSEQLEVLDRDPELRASLGGAARERARSRYDWERIADAYAKLLAERIGAAGPTT